LVTTVANSNQPDETTNSNNEIIEDFDKYFRPTPSEQTDMEPKAPPRTKKKYRKSKTVDVTRFGVVVSHENDSLENSCSEEGDLVVSPKLDFKNMDSVINESLGIRVSPSPPNKELNDSLEECLNMQTNQKDIDFLYEIGTKIERCPSGDDDDVVVINECVTFVTTIPKVTTIKGENDEDKSDMKSNSTSSSSLSKETKFERTLSKRPLWDKTPRQEVDLMFHRSPPTKQIT